LGSKGQRSRSRGTKKQVRVGLQTEGYVAACSVRKHHWVFIAAITRRTSHASNTGFSLRHFPAADAAADRQFFSAWSFSQSANGKNTAGVGQSTPVSAGFLILVI